MCRDFAFVAPTVGAEAIRNMFGKKACLDIGIVLTLGATFGGKHGFR